MGDAGGSVATGSHDTTVFAVRPLSTEPSGAEDASQISSEAVALDARRR